MTENSPARSEVTLITGRAGTGKTERCLQEYRRELRIAQQQGRPAALLWLTPTELSRRQVLSQLPDESLPVCFAPGVMTFESLAESILARSSQPVQPLDPAVQRRLLRRLINDFHRQGRLDYFARIAPAEGFLNLVGSFIAELKRGEIWPEKFRELVDRPQTHRKHRELADLYERYQQLLQQEGLYDGVGRFWSARDVLAREGAAVFEERTLLVADGFADFTETQYEILALLTRYCRRMWITLPLELPLRRQDLFAKSAATMQRLQHDFQPHATVTVQSLPDDACRLSDSLRQISAHLFADPLNVPPQEEDDDLEILAAMGPDAEANEIAARVKDLLQKGVEPADIVVAVRSLDETAALLQSRLAAAGIPVWSAAGKRLTEIPLVRTVLELLRLEEEDWPFERLRGLLRSNYFRPKRFRGKHDRSADALLEVMRRRKLYAGRQLMQKVLRRLYPAEEETPAESTGETARETSAGKAESSPAGKEERRRRRELFLRRRAWELFRFLSGSTKQWNKPTDFPGWTERLIKAARQWGMEPEKPKDESSAGITGRAFAGGATGKTSAGSSPETETDRNRSETPQELELRAWQRLTDVLFDVAEAEKLLEENEGGGPLRLSEYAEAVREILSEQELPPADDRRGCVRILEMQQVRHLDVPYLFLAGLTERNLPRLRRDDCLISERERRQWREAGYVVGYRAENRQEELLLFYSVLSRARKKLTLSFAETAADGKPQFCSPYVTAVCGLFSSGRMKPQVVGSLDPVSAIERPTTAAAVRRLAVQQLLHGEGNLFRSLLEGERRAAMARNILAGLSANAARFEQRGWTIYEGLLRRRSLRKALCERFPDDYQFSVSQLETFAGCRFRFLLSKVLGIEQLDSPEVTTDYAQRGRWLHRALAELHGEYEFDPALSLQETAEALTEHFREKISELLEERPADDELQNALTRIEEQLLQEWAGYYGEQWAAYYAALRESWDRPPVPRFLELAFGELADEFDEEPKNESAGTFPAVPFGPPAECVFIRGRIDRVDIGHYQQRPAFNVIDYKSGRSPQKKIVAEELLDGSTLQLAVYTVALLRLGLCGPEARPFQMGYWLLQTKGFESVVARSKVAVPLEEELLSELERILDALLPQLVMQLRNGEFPVDSEDKHCTSRCEFSTVCRITQLRPLQESLGKLRLDSSFAARQPRGKDEADPQKGKPS